MADENDIDVRMKNLLKDHQAMGARPGGTQTKESEYPLPAATEEETAKTTARKAPAKKK